MNLLEERVIMRHPKAIIQEAWLLASTPQEVVQFLEKRASKGKDARFEDDVDEELETALLDKNNPLINLALARYAFHEEIVRKLFFGAHGDDVYSQAIRFSVLSNQCVWSFIHGLPNVLLENEEQIITWITSANIQEISVFFMNPKLDDLFLKEFLEGNKVWQAMNEERRLVAIAALSANERMKTPYDESLMDGFRDYLYHSVFNAAWKLSEVLPTTKQWAYVLSMMFYKLERNGFSIEDPISLAGRWFLDSNDIEAIEEEKKVLTSGHLSDYQSVRNSLALLALSKSQDLLPQLLSSDDIALRCAAYTTADLTPEQIHSAYELDQKIAYNNLISNPKLWRIYPTREVLHKISWEIVDNNENSDFDAANDFNRVEERVRKDHPDWFKDEGY